MTLPKHDRSSRVKSAISLTGLMQHDFSRKYEISLATLRSWTSGARQISEKGAKKISQIMRHEGWFCSSSWLLTGDGTPPLRADSDLNAKPFFNDNIDQSTPTTANEEYCLFKETEFFRHNNKNSRAFIVDDNSMNPFFFVGDTVGAIEVKPTNYKSYIGHPCLIEIEGNKPLVRTLRSGEEGKFLFTAENQHYKGPHGFIYQEKTLSVSPIVWHRQTLANIKKTRKQQK